VIFVEQNSSSLLKIRSIIEKINDFRLTAFYGMVTVTGSITIGLNLFENNINVDEAWNAGYLDENFQTSQWGEDVEAAERRKNLRNELINAHYFLELCGK
jgi:chaperone required for assembly of F1-ATPase